MVQLHRAALLVGDGTEELVGVFRYCAMLAGKVVRTRLSQVATVITPPQGDAQVKAVPPEKLVKPKTMAEFADILVTWTMPRRSSSRVLFFVRSCLTPLPMAPCLGRARTSCGSSTSRRWRGRLVTT